MKKTRMEAVVAPRRARAAAAVAVLVLAATVLPGCPPADPQTGPGRPALERVGVAALAGQLGLQLNRSSPQCATMSDRWNSIVVLGEPNPCLFINGRRIDGQGQIALRDGELAVPREWTGMLRGSLRAPQPVVQTQDPPPHTPPDPPAGTLRGTVVLDAGHGGQDPGAQQGGLVEKHITLDVAQRIRDLLVRQGVKVVMTRQGDTYPTLEERAALANRIRPDLFVSIHADSATNTAATGFCVYLHPGASAASVQAGTRMAEALQAAGERSWGHAVKRSDFKVLRETNCPAMLIELGFLTNRHDAARLARTDYRQHLAQAIAAGVVQFLSARR